MDKTEQEYNHLQSVVKKKLPNGLEVYQNNEGETDFLYNEIFHEGDVF